MSTRLGERQRELCRPAKASDSAYRAAFGTVSFSSNCVDPPSSIIFAERTQGTFAAHWYLSNETPAMRQVSAVRAASTTARVNMPAVCVLSRHGAVELCCWVRGLISVAHLIVCRSSPARALASTLLPSGITRRTAVCFRYGCWSDIGNFYWSFIHS